MALRAKLIFIHKYKFLVLNRCQFFWATGHSPRKWGDILSFAKLLFLKVGNPETCVERNYIFLLALEEPSYTELSARNVVKSVISLLL